MDDIKLRARAKINITLDAIRKWIPRVGNDNANCKSL